MAFSRITDTRWDKLVMLCANRGDSDRELLACNSLISKLDLENDVIRLQIQNSALKEHPNASMERYYLIKLFRLQYHII